MTQDEKILRDRVKACREWYRKANVSQDFVESVKASNAVTAAERALTFFKYKAAT